MTIAVLMTVALAIGSDGNLTLDAGEQAALEQRCDRGAADACRTLGRAYLVAGGEQQTRLGAAYVEFACELADAPACGDLGALHALGLGVAYDATKAAALSRRACGVGVGIACANLGVLIVEDSGGFLSGKPTGEALQQFRTACDAGSAEGCLDLAAVEDAGAVPGGRKDREGALGALRKAFDLASPLACYRLLGLHPEQGKSASATSEALRAACQASIAPACKALGLARPPPAAMTPSPCLLADPDSLVIGLHGMGGFCPTDLAPRSTAERLGREALHPSADVLASVPAALLGRLELDRATPSKDPTDRAIGLLLPHRRIELGECLEAPRRAPLLMATLGVSFLVEPDGHTSSIRAAAQPVEPDVEACARALVSDWVFPFSTRTVGPFALSFDLEPLPRGEAPLYPGRSGLRPVARDPSCLKLPSERDVAEPIAMKLAVDVDGRPLLVHPISVAPDRRLKEAARAVRSCHFVPGTGEDGRPALVWTTVTLEALP